jgi:hypothetical protein
MLVSSPAKSSVTPNARMTGQAVGAGNWIVLGAPSGFSTDRSGVAIGICVPQRPIT